MELLWLRSVVRFLIRPIVRWASIGGNTTITLVRTQEDIWLDYEGPYGETYTRSYTVDEARQWGRDWLMAARNLQEGSPISPTLSCKSKG